MFWDHAHFINQLLVSLCITSADYFCCKDYSLIFSSDRYMKGTMLLSRKNFSVVIIFYWLLAIKKT